VANDSKIEAKPASQGAAGQAPTGSGGDAHATRIDPAGELRPLEQIPFLKLLGVLWRDLGPGRSELVLDQQLHHQNSLEMAHGGVIMTLLDVAMARAGSTLAEPERGERSVLITIEMKTTFMKPARGRVACVGKLLQRSASLCFCEGTLYGASGERLAHATGTFKFLAGLPVGGRRIQSRDASD
jgi:uncharacterized protein (TIGR00369 family)